MRIGGVIAGKVPSKSNCYRIATGRGGRHTLVKQADLTGYEQQFWWQCPRRGKPGAPLISTAFRLEVDVYYHKHHCDLDNAFKIILDALQKPCYVVSDDDLCMEIVARKHIDRANPRIEFIIETIDE